jgi:hypothetical protein
MMTLQGEIQMKRWLTGICLLLMLGAASFAVAESPFVGTWKLNQGKSHLGGSTLKFSSAGNGMMRETVAEGTYTFKADGKSYPALFGDSESWEKLSGHSWKVTVHGTGGYTYSETLNISEDGKSLTDVVNGTHPDGSAFETTTVYTRMAAGKGLMGTWKSTAVKATSDRTLEFSANGDDGLSWKLPQIKAVLNAKFDGKDTSPEGPTVPKGLTIAMTGSGPNMFRFVEKMNGKPVFTGRYSVSTDGKTLTQIGRPTGQAQPETSVYDKQ